MLVCPVTAEQCQNTTVALIRMALFLEQVIYRSFGFLAKVAAPSAGTVQAITRSSPGSWHMVCKRCGHIGGDCGPRLLGVICSLVIRGKNVPAELTIRAIIGACTPDIHPCFQIYCPGNISYAGRCCDKGVGHAPIQ